MLLSPKKDTVVLCILKLYHKNTIKLFIPIFLRHFISKLLTQRIKQRTSDITGLGSADLIVNLSSY